MSSCSIVARLLERAATHPDAMALVFVGDNDVERRFSLSDLLIQAGRFAALLADQRVGPGDVVLIALPASPEQVFAFWGTLLLGGTPSLFPYARPDGLDTQLYALAAAAGARAVLVSGGVGDWPAPHDVAACPLIDLAGCGLPSPGGVPAPAPVAEEAIGYLQFTSGTTGLGKGVRLSHGAIVRFGEAFSDALDITSADVSVNWLPLYHDFGLFAGLVVPLLSGAPVVMLSPLKWVRRPAALFAAIHRHRATLTWSSNAAYLHAVRQLSDADLSGVDLGSLRVWGAGGEPVLYHCQQSFFDRFAAYGLRETAILSGYGMAENTLCVSLNRPGRRCNVDWVDAAALGREGRVERRESGAALARPVVSCGAPLVRTEVRILDDTGNLLGERQVGSIHVRSPSLFSGYHNRPDLTAAVLDDEGWYRTRDSGYLAEGELYVLGRRDDLIKQAGHGIYPQDIEAIAEALPEVRPGRAAAFGLLDARLGTERVVVVCDLAPGVSEQDYPRIERDLRRAVYSELQVTLGDVLLSRRGGVMKTANGKLSRALTRKRYLEQRA